MTSNDVQWQLPVHQRTLPTIHGHFAGHVLVLFLAEEAIQVSK